MACCYGVLTVYAGTSNKNILYTRRLVVYRNQVMVV